MMEAPRIASQDEVPLLDLSLLGQAGGADELAFALRQACLSLGFFYVGGHGVAPAVRSGIFDATRRYFDLPADDKNRDLVDARFMRGYMPIGVSHTPGMEPDLKESYDLSLDLPLDDPDVIAGRFLHGPNRWPERHPWLRAAAEPYFDGVMDIGRALLRLFAISLELRPEFFLDLCRKPTMHMRLFHYFAQDRASGEDMYGAPPHTDLGMMTILDQDPIGGLEIRKRDGEWIGAPYLENTFVVNVGDLFSIWTNDLYVSTPHRVVNRSGRDRYSIPTFLSPDFMTLVECLPGCVAAGETPRHSPLRSGEYLEDVLRREHVLPAAQP